MITFATVIKNQNLQMDIVDRLKQFIDYLEIPVTKFADNCEIPRPTLSQLTNGRNKSVRNELVEKIHRAYPDLSMIWLMFGEGDMLHNENIEISEAQNKPSAPLQQQQASINEMVMPTLDFDSVDTFGDSENFVTPEQPVSPSTGASIEFGEPATELPTTHEPSGMTIPTDKSKHVVRIIAYYSDNSYQEFFPHS